MMIQMMDVVKRYQMGEETLYALDHISISVERGEFLAVVGPSGSGKSTLMNIMGCLDVADSGEYLLNEIPISKYSERELAHIRNQNIGFVFQNFNLLPKLTAIENVELPLIYQNKKTKERHRLAKEALERVGLEERMGHRPSQLSGGQQQRVAIARALITQPSILLADEPTGNLDSATGKEIIALFHELHAAGNTIILITHDDKVAKQAKRQVHIEDGKINEQGEMT